MLKSLIETVKNNPVLAGFVGMYGVGVLTYLMRNIPTKIYNFVKRHITTDLTITSQHRSFHNALYWFQIKLKDKNYRKIKLSNGRWGDDENTIKTIGYSYHWLWYDKRPLLVTLKKEDANQTSYDKEIIHIMKFGRSHKLFDKMINEFEKDDNDKNKIKIYKMRSDWWGYVKKHPKRVLSSVFIEKEKEKKLIYTIDKFIFSESWYLDHGIPYQLGILLYGHPGTGKTSLVKALASYLNYAIYYLSPGKLGNLENALTQLPEKSIVVIEDIDSSYITHERNEKKEEESKLLNKSIKKTKSTREEAIDALGDIGLSEILNSLDGFFSTHGRILMATTNHVEKLDKALLRPGRFDLKIKIGYVNNEILQLFIDKFFPKYNKKITIEIRDKITVAELQNLVLEEKTAEEIIEWCRK